MEVARPAYLAPCVNASAIKADAKQESLMRPIGSTSKSRNSRGTTSKQGPNAGARALRPRAEPASTHRWGAAKSSGRSECYRARGGVAGACRECRSCSCSSGLLTLPVDAECVASDAPSCDSSARDCVSLDRDRRLQQRARVNRVVLFRCEQRGSALSSESHEETVTVALLLSS